MHILVLYPYFGTPKGGWSTRVYELGKIWVREGHHVTVITAPYEKSDIKTKTFISQQTIDGIQLIVIDSGDSNRFPFWKRVFRALLFSITASWFAVSKKSDWIIASSGPITMGIPALVARFLKGKKYVFEVRDLWPQGAIELNIIRNRFLIRLGYWFEGGCYKNAQWVVPCSIGMEASIRARYPGLKTLVIPHGASDIFQKPVPEYPSIFPKALENKKLFIYAGSLGLIDDCMQILKGYQLIRNPDIALVFMGDGAERYALEQFAQHHSLQNVIFLGLIPKYEVAKWFSIATASILTVKDIPFLHTCSPNKLYDSLSAGLPIIHNTKGWIKDLVERADCGITVPPNHPLAWSTAIETLASDSQKAQDMGRNAFHIFQTEFDTRKNALKYLEALTL